MANQRNATLAGGFILLAAALAVGIAVAIEGGHLSQAAPDRAVRFKLSDDLGGLRAGDDVRLGGFKVGTVSSIEPENVQGADPHLLVRFSMPAAYVLREDATVGVQSTLTGNACVNIESLGNPARAVAAGPVEGQPDPKTLLLARLGGRDGLISRFQTSTLPEVEKTVKSFHDAGDSANALVKDLHGQLDGVVLPQYSDVARRTGRMMDSVHDMIGPTTQDFHGLMSDLHEISGDVKGQLPDLLKRTGLALGSAQTALEGARLTAENTREISDSLKSVINGNKSKLDEIIGALKVTADNMKSASVEIRHSPWRLLYKPSSAEMSNLNVYDAARQFADGANDLNDAARALEQATKEGKVSKEQMQALISRLEKSFKTFEAVEQKLWRDVKE